MRKADKLRIEETSAAEGNSSIDSVGNKYRFHIAIPRLPGKHTRTASADLRAIADRKVNKPQNSSSESSIEMMPIVITNGVLAP